MNNYSEESVKIKCNKAIAGGKCEELRLLLSNNPHIVEDLTEMSDLMHYAASRGTPDCAKILKLFGCDVNIPHSISPVKCSPLIDAMYSGKLDTVKWFVENGANINFGHGDGFVGSLALCLAALNGSVEIAIYLIEAGADVNSHNARFMTALDAALMRGHQELAAELRRRGGVTGSELPDYVPPPAVPAVLRAVDAMAPVYVDPRVWPDPSGRPVSIRAGFGDGIAILFTQGLSDVALKTPDGMNAFRHAELVLFVNDGTIANADGKLFENPQDALAAWVADWLFKIAEMGIAGGEWFGDDFGIISNGDNPDPLTAGTDMTTWLLLPEKPPFERFRTDNGDDALFYTLYPIHTSERDFVRMEGLIPLLRLFEKNHVYDEISLNRPPVA